MHIVRSVLISVFRVIFVFLTGALVGGLAFVVWYGDPHLHDDTSDTEVYSYSTGGTDPYTDLSQGHDDATRYLSMSGASSVCITDPKISVFMYHYVREYDPHDPALVQNLSLDPNLFEAHMKYIRELQDHGLVYVAKLSELDTFRKSKCFPNKHVFVLTADDGWDDTYTRIFWLARKYRLPFGIGLITSKLNTPGFVTDAQVKEMVASGTIEIYSHSVNHLDQNKLDVKSETREICDSKTILEQKFGQPIQGFIYPAGKVSKHSTQILRQCQYSYAFTTQIGVNHVADLGSYLIHRERVANNWKYSIFLRYVQ